MNVRVSDRELATFLAALRYWQQNLADNENEVPVAEHFDARTTPLTIAEIDNLCERLNGGPAAA